MGYKYNDCAPNDLTVMFTIAAWYMNIDVHTTSYDVLDWSCKHSLALIELV